MVLLQVSNLKTFINLKKFITFKYYHKKYKSRNLKTSFSPYKALRIIWWRHFYPTQSLESRSFLGLRPLDPDPFLKLAPPLTSNRGSAPGNTFFIKSGSRVLPNSVFTKTKKQTKQHKKTLCGCIVRTRPTLYI